jgi:integrase
MPRAATGQLIERRAGDDVVWTVRFRAAGYPKHPIELGRASSGWTRARAEQERELVRAQILDGSWRPVARQPRRPAVARVPTFAEEADKYVARKRLSLAENSLRDLKTKLEVHLLPVLGDEPVDVFDEDLLFAYLAAKHAENERIARARAAGRPLTRAGPHGARLPLRAIGNGQLNKHIELVGAILQPSVKRRLLPYNPARLDIAESTAVYHYHRAREARTAAVAPVDAALIHVLLLAGLRIDEALALHCGDVDLTHRMLRVRDSKSPSGVREVDIHPPLLEVLLALREARGNAWRPEALVFANRHGGKRSRQAVARGPVRRLVELVDARRRELGLPPIAAKVTPHTFRHAYVALMAFTGAPLVYTRDQVGHRHHATTERLYNYVLRGETRLRVGQQLASTLVDARAQRQ